MSRRRAVGGGTGRLALLMLLLGGTLVRGQTPPPTPAASTRYRFVESYTVQNAQTASPGVVGQARVALRETLSTAIDQPQSAPVLKEQVIQAIYQERPAEVNPVDSRLVTATVRRYEMVRAEPTLSVPKQGPALFADLTVHVTPRPDEIPSAELRVLTPGRSLREAEFEFASRQTFVPALIHALPQGPVRVGETYDVGEAAGPALLGGMVQAAGLELSGRLVDVRDAPGAAGQKVAGLELTARGQTDRGQASTRARIDFTFQPGTDASEPGVVTASGHVTRLRLAQEITRAGTAGGQRLKQFIRRELVLERRTADPGPALELPNPLPERTLENSWLVYEDPAGRFVMRHPQELQRIGGGDPKDGQIPLVHFRPDGWDQVIVAVQPQDELRPEVVQKQLQDRWRAGGVQTEQVVAESLPEADWDGMQVYRIATKLSGAGGPAPGQASGPITYAAYIVRPGVNDGLFLESTTSDPEGDLLRAKVETMIRQFRFAGAGAAAPAPAPTRPADGTSPAPEPTNPPAAPPAPAGTATPR